MKNAKGKRGDILIGDIIFLILNLVFISILIIFVVSKTNDASLLEEKYAKEIALVIDSSKAGMEIHLNMEDAIEKAEKNNIEISKIVKINDNIITVKIKEKGEYSYSFFNNVSVNPYIDTTNNKEWVFMITSGK